MPIIRMFSVMGGRKLQVTEDSSYVFHGGKIHVIIRE